MDQAGPGLIDVSVVYAGVGAVRVIALRVAPGLSVGRVLDASGILALCPEIDLQVNRVGIFNRICSLGDLVAAGDRVEIYRPLQADPKDSRRRRAAARNAGSKT